MFGAGFECPDPNCIFCIQKITDPVKRALKFREYYQGLATKDPETQVMAISSIWGTAMRSSTDFARYQISLGILDCLLGILNRSNRGDKKWFKDHDRNFLPYYCLHMLGSFLCHDAPDIASTMIDEGAIPILCRFANGELSWIEQRVALRAMIGLVALGGKPACDLMIEHGGLKAAAMAALEGPKIVFDQHVSNLHHIEGAHVDIIVRGETGHIGTVTLAMGWGMHYQYWGANLLEALIKANPKRAALELPDFLPRVCNAFESFSTWTFDTATAESKWPNNQKMNVYSWVGLQRCVAAFLNPSTDIPSDVLAATIKACPTFLSITLPEIIRGPCPDLSCATILDGLTRLVPHLSFDEVLPTAIAVTDTLEWKLSHFAQLSRSVRAFFATSPSGIPENISLFLDVITASSKSDIQIGMAHKDQGAEKFKSGDYQGAIECYMQALSALPHEAARSARLACFSNLAECHLRLGDYAQCVSFASKAMFPEHMSAKCTTKDEQILRKACFRRAKAYEALGRIARACEDFIMASLLKVDGNDAPFSGPGFQEYRTLLPICNPYSRALSVADESLKTSCEQLAKIKATEENTGKWEWEYLIEYSEAMDSYREGHGDPFVFHFAECMYPVVWHCAKQDYDPRRYPWSGEQ